MIGNVTSNKTWNGFGSQVVRAARITSWHLATNWTPRRKGLEPSSLPRWQFGKANSVEILDDNGGKLGQHQCATRAEFAQLRFTPHLKVLEANETLMRAYAPLFYL